jgi:hypothetical protein
MKKAAFFMIVVISFITLSCEKIEDISVGFETAIKTDMPVVSQKIGSEEYGFIGGGVFTLSSDQEISKHMDNIQELIALNGSLIKFNGANPGNKILNMTMKYGIKTNSNEEPAMIPVFSFIGQLGEKNGTIDYLSDAWAPVLIKAMSKNLDKVFVISLEGKANYNVNLPVKLNVPIKVNTTPLQ